MSAIDKKLRLKLFLIFIPVAYFSCFFHELGHWIIGEILGYDMFLTLNGSGIKNGQQFVENTHYLYHLFGGVCFTIFLTLIFWGVIEKYKVIYVYPFVLLNFIHRLFPQIIKFEYQDEAKISTLLGIGKYTIAIIVLISLLLITWRSSRVLKINYKDNLLFAFVSIICLLLVVVTDELLFK